MHIHVIEPTSISEISKERVNNVEDVLKEGQIVDVKVITLEDENKFNLSMKALVVEEKKEENQ